MGDKFTNKEFGVCPRVYCQNQAVLPVGYDNRMGISSVKVFCPRCKDIYNPNKLILNGNIFFFLMNYKLENLICCRN